MSAISRIPHRLRPAATAREAGTIGLDGAWTGNRPRHEVARDGHAAAGDIGRNSRRSQRALPDVEQLHLEHQAGVSRNRTIRRARRPVAEIGGDD